jgi:APA family basic amino acid/polyamine antiporter
MIGAGVLLSTGFMAQEMSPAAILVAWSLGLIIALLGAWTYGSIAGINQKSGGEYRYLTDYLHPALGYQAGWASLLIGFSAPIAVDAAVIGAFANTLVDSSLDPRVVGSFVIIGLTALHARKASISTLTQNSLVLVKVCLILVFLSFGIIWGQHAWPTWQPPSPSETPTMAFFMQQYWIAFAFSGWNAAIYAAGEFKRPGRDVPFAMLVGTLSVGILYLFINWVFVANLPPELAAGVMGYEETQVTLAHLVSIKLAGPIGGTITSALAIITFISAMSAMTMIGPRVYAAMATDGYLPKWLAMNDNEPPFGGVLLQGSIAMLFLWTHSIREAVESASIVLMVFTALTACCIFNIARRSDLPTPPIGAMVTAALFILAQVGLIGVGLSMSKLLTFEFIGLITIGLAAYYVSIRNAGPTDGQGNPDRVG